MANTERLSLLEQGLRCGDGQKFLALLHDWRLDISKGQEQEEILRLFLLITRAELPPSDYASVKDVLAFELENELTVSPGYLYNHLSSIGRWFLLLHDTEKSPEPLPDFDDPANNESLDIIGKYLFIENVTKKDYKFDLIEELFFKGTRAQCYAFILLCQTSPDILKIIELFPHLIMHEEITSSMKSS